MKRIKTIHWLLGEENKEYLELEKKIREGGKSLAGAYLDDEEWFPCGWHGDFLVSLYRFEGKIYRVEDDMEYGIPSSIIVYGGEDDVR